MQPRYVCSLKTDIIHSVVGECYTQIRVLECPLIQLALHITACLLTNSSSDVIMYII
jgi:hypothetical protein